MKLSAGFALFSCALAAFACSGGSSSDSDFAGSDLARKNHSVALNDLSILFPLPEQGKSSTLLDPTSAGPRGQLLPKALFEQLPTLTADATSPSEVYDKLRVVSVRFDPCHTGFDAAHGGECQPQVRLQMQRPDVIGMEEPPKNNKEAEVAVHLIYAVTAGEFRELVGELVTARESSGQTLAGEPLDVHPILRNQGLEGDYAKTVKSTVLKHAGDTNLTRVAFSALRNVPPPAGAIDTFGFEMGHFDVRGHTLVPRTVATTDSAVPQDETIFFFPPAAPQAPPGFRATVVPAGKSADGETINKKIFDSSVISTISQAEAQGAFDATLRVDDPRKHGLETVDCVTCHSSTSGRIVLGLIRGFDAEMPRPDRFVSKENLALRRTVVPTNDSNILFGYKARTATGPRIALGQRVVNETAAAVEYLNTK